MSALLVQQRSPAPGPGRPPWRRWLDRLVEGPRAVVLVALAAGVIWLPTLARPMSSDEGGFLLVASQWSPGRSLYGSYWVDRPPLLIALFQLADLGGGLVALRLLGLAAVVTSVLVSGRIGALAAPSVRWAPALAAATCGAFVTTPLFGAGEVDGELLAVPFLLASILSVLVALGSAPQRDGWLRGAGPWWTLAGASAMTAVLVKQSMLDGFVLAAAVVVWLLVRTGRGETMRAVAAYTLGAGGLLGSVLLWASSRGTGPVDLWRAVVVFRADAAAVISTEASASTPARAETLVISFLTSGALAVILLALLPRIHGWRWASAPRDHVPPGPPAGRGALERRAARGRPQLPAAARRVPPPRGPAGHAQGLPRRRPPLPAGAALHDRLRSPSPASAGQPARSDSIARTAAWRVATSVGRSWRS